MSNWGSLQHEKDLFIINKQEDINQGPHILTRRVLQHAYHLAIRQLSEVISQRILNEKWPGRSRSNRKNLLHQKKFENILHAASHNQKAKKIRAFPADTKSR